MSFAGKMGGEAGAETRILSCALSGRDDLRGAPV